METELRGRRRNADRPQDAGFTLTEMLIVITILGILMTTLATVIIVVFRASPGADQRTDDARSIQGLVTWLPQDVDATPPDGFDTDVNAWPCGGTAPPQSHNVLTMRWTESTTTVTYHAASYRYEKRGDIWTMVRYVCDDPTATPSRVNLTSELPDWSTDPTDVVLCPVAIDASAGGVCPAPHPDTATNPDPVLSVKLTVTLQNGVRSTIDAAPKNPDQNLADDPKATFNKPPFVPNTAPTFYVQQGKTTTIDLITALQNLAAPAPFNQIHDPDGDTSLLTVSIDPVEPEPDGDPANPYVEAATAWPLELDITVAYNAPLGETTNALVLIISDEDGGWEAITATIIVQPAVDLPVQSNDPIASIYVPAGDSRSIADMVAEFQLVDEDLSTLSFSVVTSLPGVTTTGPGLPPGYEFEVAVDGSLDLIATPAGTYLGDLALSVSDATPTNPPAVIFVTVYVQPATTPNAPPTAADPDIDTTIEAGQTISITVTNAPAAGHGVTDPDPADTLTIDPSSVVTPAGITATLTGALTISLEADITLPAGAMSTPVELAVVDPDGQDVDLTISISITVPPPPASSCVLQTLTATPNPVARENTTGSAAKHLNQSVTVTLTYAGTCDGLRLNYDTGHATGLGTGVGRTFPPNSPTSITIVGIAGGGTEKFTPGPHALVASTTSPVAAPNPSSLTHTLQVS